MAEDGSNGRPGHTKPFTNSDLADTEISPKGEKMNDQEDPQFQGVEPQFTVWKAVLEAIDAQDQLVAEGASQLVDSLEAVDDPGLSLIASLMHVQIMATLNTNSTLRWMLTAMLGEAEIEEIDDTNGET